MTVWVRNIKIHGGRDEAELLKLALKEQSARWEGLEKNGKIEKDRETEEKVAISCAGGKREFKQNMKKEVFA